MIKLDKNSLVVVTGAVVVTGVVVVNERNFVGKVTDKNFINRVVSFCAEQKYDTLSLINNAGVTFPSEYPYPIENWDKTIEVNLSAPFQWIEAFIPLFKKVSNSSIINITSLAAELAFPNNPAYIASNGGLKMLTKFYAKSLGRYGVRANNIAPGYIVTDMTKASYSNEKIRANREAHTFLGRWGLPSDVADVCLFLCSNESRYITGQDICVDGGWTANGLIE